MLIGAFAYWRRNRNVVNAACAYAAVLAGAELLLHIDGIGTVPLGLAAAGVLWALPSRFRSIWPVSVALLLAVASDLIPPENYWPFLNRRALALTAVLGSGFVLLRNKTEARACLLLIGLLATVEVASAVDSAGGASPWSHLLLDARTTVGASPLWNARFFFLVGAAAMAFLAARRWRPASVFGHIYVAAALGAELVGLVDPALRSHPWRMFGDPGQFMAEQLWLTGLLLSYGTVLVAVGIARDGALMRKVGLGFLAAGALKVSMIDLSSLDALYRVGSFLVLGATFLLGSYAYNRLRLHSDE